MDFTIDQSSLSRALRLVGRAVPTRASLPILQAVLLEAEPGRLKLSATDTDLGVVTTLAADVSQLGRAAMPARLLTDYVSQLPAESVQLALDPARQRVRATCGRFKADLAILDPEGFPQFPARDEQRTFELAPSALRKAIERVVLAASRDDSRPVLTAVLFDFGETGLTLAAADGFRLARARLPEAVGASRQLLVPARAVAEFGRLLAEGEKARIALTPDDRGIHLVVGPTTLYTRLVEGRFPDIARVIPTTWQTKVAVDTHHFRQAVRLTSLFGQQGANRPVVLEAETGTLRLRARGDETGEAESELAATLEGEAQAIALNTGLLSDVLDVVDAAELRLSWTRPTLPLVVQEAGGTLDDDLFILMPLHDPTLVAARQAQAA